MANLHELHYTENSITVCGTKEVIEFSENEILLSLEGTGLRLNGRNLKIKEVDLEKGIMKASGTITSVSYGGSKESFIKRIFK